MGGKEIATFFAMLADERKVAPFTHRQALGVLLFFYKGLSELALPRIREIIRPTPAKPFRWC
jgi:hypothetical protein